MQPLWLTDSSLAFIFWGILAAAAGATLGQMASTEPAPVSKD
jgi:hypothetical protein